MATLTSAAAGAVVGDALANRLLAATTVPGLERLIEPALLVDAATGDVFYEPGGTAPWVFFPLSCVVSVLTVLDDGSAVETATIGREGMVGAFHALGDDRSPNERAVVQMGGRVLRIDRDEFRREVARDPKLSAAIDGYVRALLVHVTQSVACTAAHTVRQRLARWLLHTTDRVASDEVELTHEFLAHILHVRRASVTVALRELQGLAAIETRRGKTTVLDRASLTRHACECYAVVNEEYARLIPGEPPIA